MLYSTIPSYMDMFKYELALIVRGDSDTTQIIVFSMTVFESTLLDTVFDRPYKCIRGYGENLNAVRYVKRYMR